MTIKEKREEIGLSRTEISRRLEIPIRTLENWEAGVNHPPVWAEKLILKELDNIGNELFTISLEEWERLDWFNSGIEYTHYTPDCLWENDYKVVGEFKIENVNIPEYLFQKDGQLYICRHKLAKVYSDGNKVLYAGEKPSEPMKDLWEEKMYKNLSVDYKIRVRKDGIIFCDRDARLYNFLKRNNVIFVPEFDRLRYYAARIEYLDVFKKAVEKYPKYKLVYQPEKSINVKG